MNYNSKKKDYKSFKDDELFQEVGRLQDLITIYYCDTNSVTEFVRTLKVVENEIRVRGLEWKPSI
jgi:hypothetical protein